MDKIPILGLSLKDPLVLIGGALVGGWLLLADNSPLNTFLFGDVAYAAAEDPQPQTLPAQPPRPDRPPRPGPGMPPGPPRPGGGGPGGGAGHPGGPPTNHPGPWPRPGPPNRPPDWRIPRPDPRRPRYPTPPRFHWPTLNFRIPRYPWLGLPENNISYEQCVWAGEQLGKDTTQCCQDAFEMGRNILINEVENCLYCNQRAC